MFSRSTISAMVGGMALGAGIVMAVMANAQNPAPAPMGAPVGTPTGGSTVGPAGLAITGLSSDTFVTVKDQGDSQTVSVFKVDGKGINHLTHKAKFFY